MNGNERVWRRIVDDLVIGDLEPVGEYCYVRLLGRWSRGSDRGEVSATTIVLAAALIGLAISVGVIISGKVRDKANSLNLG